mmetsp:Transcript_733/g.4640  ORF Transcript_733/g.4640 Transcript_733/m.4640 type:complete len:269 (-) Transcript_733:584-1390(-)
MNITDGCNLPATANKARTIFSPSPIHLLVSELALMLKNVALMFPATAFPIRVLPVPGGPKSRRPFGGARAPLNSSVFIMGHTTSSLMSCFASFWPAISSQLVRLVLSMISLHTCSTIFGSMLHSGSGSSPLSSASMSMCFLEMGPSSSSPPPAESMAFFMKGGTKPPRPAPGCMDLPPRCLSRRRGQCFGPAGNISLAIFPIDSNSAAAALFPFFLCSAISFVRAVTNPPVAAGDWSPASGGPSTCMGSASAQVSVFFATHCFLAVRS